MAESTIFPAFAKLAHQPDEGSKRGFLRSLSETVTEGNQTLSELGKGIDPLAGMSSIVRRQIDEMTKSMQGGGIADIGTAAAEKAAATAALRVTAARNLAEASERAALAAGDESRAAQAAIAAARALVTQEEQAAASAREYATSLRAVQTELDKVTAESGQTATALGRTGAANDNAHQASGRFRAGAQQLGYQLSDLGVQLSMAANSTNAGKMALMAFSQQFPQAVQAVALMRGEATGLIGFLAGPWGMGLTAAASLIGTLALAHHDAADASKAHEDAAKDLTKAIDELHASAVRESRSTQASIQDDIDKANSLRQRAQEARKTAIAELQLAQQKAAAAGTSAVPGGPAYFAPTMVGQQAAQQATARELQSQIDALNAEIGKANETIRLKRGAQIRQSVREELDASASATGRYERALDRLNAQQQAGAITEAQYRAELTKIEKAHDAATEAAGRSTKAHRSNTSAAHEEAEAAKKLKAAIAELVQTYGGPSKGLGDAVHAQGEADFAQMMEQIGRHRDAIVQPLEEAAAASAAWREQLQGVLGDLGQIGGFAGKLGSVASVLTGNASGIGGPGGVLLRGLLNTQWATTDSKGDRIILKLSDELDRFFGRSGSLAKVLEGASTGAAAGAIFLGSNGNNAGSAIGGAIGNTLGEKFLGPALGKAFGSLGSALGGPLGSALGGVLGGAIGSLFTTQPHGSAAVTNSSVTSTASDAGISASLDSFGLGLQTTIANIADQLGGSVGSYDVGIGRYKDYYQVSAVGNDQALGHTYYNQRSANALYDGKDAEAAMRAAIANAIADGAIEGVRAGTQALLKSGTDIQRQLQKALDFENAFKRLKEYTDPVGAAVDTVNAEFKKLKATFEEAGASAADYADLEKLYGLERAKAVKAATDQLLGSLQSLRDQLTVGNSALSLRDREAMALATYQPLADRVKAGDTTAYDDYAAAAQTLLDIERQMSGSQSDYFALQDEITSLTKATIAAETAKANAATSSDSPFSTSASTSTTTANDNSSVTNAIEALATKLLDGLGYKLDAVNTNLGSLIQQVINSGSLGSEYTALLKTGTW